MKKENTDIVKVGVCCWILNKNGQVLLGKRLSKHGHNLWAAPGGHIEFGETPIQCASRELFEETGIKIPPARFKEFEFTNDIFEKENKQYITIHCIVEKPVSKEPKIMEPNKCEKWQWFDKDKLPKPLFLPVKNLLKKMQ